MHKSEVAIILELENAKNANIPKDLADALNSIAKSLDLLCRKMNNYGDLILTGKKELCERAWDYLQTDGQTHFHFKVKIFDNSGDGYFSAKTRSIDSTNAEFIIFCDSDCIYELMYATKMYLAAKNSPKSVIYGKTFAAPPENKMEGYSALAWLFPPEEIGYGGSWPKSTWANSMAFHRSTLEKHPFPDISIRALPRIETKQERPIWSTYIKRFSISEVQIDAIAYHKQFSTWWTWFKRQFIHGVGLSIEKDRAVSGFSALGKTQEHSRQTHLRELYVSELLSVEQFRGARRLLVVALLGKILGYLTGKMLRFSHLIRWPDATPLKERDSRKME